MIGMLYRSPSALSCLRQCIVNNLILSRYSSSYGDIVNSKGLDGAVKLGDSKFWDAQYSTCDCNKTEWYINARQAASFLKQILLQREIIHPTKLNILLEIGCGSAPLVLPLTKYFANSKYKVLGVATDASNVCISELRRSHTRHVAALREPKQPIFRTDADGKGFSFLSRGVVCNVLDIKDFKSFCQDMEYFPIRDIDFYKSKVGLSDEDLESYRTNIIAVDKGCLDALIWDKNVDLVKNVLDHSDAIVSISGEDPDIRLGYFQTQYGKLFSVHFSENSEIYGYSFFKKSDEDFKSVQNTVQQELKSYSSALTKSCSSALSPKKLEAAVRKVAVTEDMGKNAIVYGLAEAEHEKLLEKVEQVLAEIGERPKLTNCCRVGTKRDNAIRPVKITLNSSDHVNQILRNAKLLRAKEGYSGIYICPDRTAEQRKAHKQLWDQLKAKRKSEPLKS